MKTKKTTRAAKVQPDCGGLAFPLRHPEHEYSETGMGLRDYFAGQVIAGIYANSTWDLLHEPDLADAAYKAADAMIAHKRRTEGGSK